MPGRSATLLGVLCLSLIALVVSGYQALDLILFHGFAPACSDGYVNANGADAACGADWDAAAPYLLVLGASLVVAGASAAGLRSRSKAQAGQGVPA